MRYLVGWLLIFGLAGAAFGQQAPGQSLGGFGSILHPGLGHTPQTPPGGANGPYFFGNGRGGGYLGSPVSADHPRHGRTVIVPYPVYYGPGYGYGYGYDPTVGYSPQSYPPDQLPTVNPMGAPSVVINHNYFPPQANPQVRDYAPGDGSQDQQQQQSGLRLYQTPPTRPFADSGQNASPRRSGNDDQETVYLIAFKDHTIVQALGYWMEGSTLHYVNTEHSLNQISSSLVDRELSQRLNDERGVEFKMPQAR